MANAVVNAILAATQDAQVRAAMLMGSYLESTWNTGSVGDNGTSFGPFQIHLPAHPGVTANQAEDPTFAVGFMLPAYQQGVSKVPSSLWSSNPSLAAATAAYYAERPTVMYPSSRVGAAWPQVQAALGNPSSIAGGTGGGATGGTGSATDTSLVSATGGIVANVVNYLWFGALAGVGSFLVIVGLVLLFRGVGGSATSNAVVSAIRTVGRR